MTYPTEPDAVAVTPSGTLDLGDTTPTHTAHHTQLRSAIQSIRTELGAGPRGGFTDATARLVSVENRLTALEARVAALETPAAGGTTTTVDFTGTNGAAWPAPAGAPFAQYITSTGASATIQSNRGRLTVGAISGYGALQVMGFIPANQLFTMKVDMVVTADNVAGEALQRLCWCSQDGAQQYMVELRSYVSELDIVRENSDFSFTRQLLVTGLGIVAGDTMHLKVQRDIGNVHRIKWWKNTALEPSAWGATFTDGIYTTGRILLFGQGGNVAAAKTFDFDNFVYTPAS